QDREHAPRGIIPLLLGELELAQRVLARGHRAAADEEDEQVAALYGRAYLRVEPLAGRQRRAVVEHGVAVLAEREADAGGGVPLVRGVREEHRAHGPSRRRLSARARCGPLPGARRAALGPPRVRPSTRRPRL